MTGIELTTGDWIELLTHIKRWVSNLLRAGEQRKAQSKEALRSVIRAVRETEIYVRHLHEGGKKSITTERALAVRWTDLSFALEDLELESLAKRPEPVAGSQTGPQGAIWRAPGVQYVQAVECILSN